MRRNLIFFLFSLTFVSIISADYQYDYFSDRISREFRNGYDVEDWIERGNATVTASPDFVDGVRLTAWASAYTEGEDYEFAIASAVYHFEIPRNCQYIEIRLRYRGESTSANLDDYDNIAGRVWVCNTRSRNLRHRQDDSEETRYGDTFILRAKRRAETIKIPAANHTKDGLMELHVVVDGSGQIVVESITVSAYRHQPEIQIVERHIDNYRWKPWHQYSYLYFYDGPIYYTYPGHYLAWHYPAHHRFYLSMRRSYGGTAHWYYRNRRPPYRRYGHRLVNDIHILSTAVPERNQLSFWSDDYETTHQLYRLPQNQVSTLNRTVLDSEVQSVMKQHRTQPSLSPRQIKDRLISMKRRQSIVRRSNGRDFSQMRDIIASEDRNRRDYFGNQHQGGNDVPYTLQRQRSTPISRSNNVLEKHRSLRSYQQSARQQTRRRSTSSTQTSNSSRSGEDEKKQKSNRNRNTQRTRRR